MTRQRFPDQTQASYVQLVVVPTCAGGHCIGCETRVAKGFDDRLAGAVQIIMLVGCKSGEVVRSPSIKSLGEFPVLFIEKGPVQEALVAHPVIPQRQVIPSIALENGLLFVDKGIVCPPKILSLHADRLSLRFTLNGLIDRHVPLLM